MKTCFVCRERPVRSLGRCERCYGYQRTHDHEWSEKPARLPTCANCDEFHSNHGSRCVKCSTYLTRNGIERPRDPCECQPIGPRPKGVPDDFICNDCLDRFSRWLKRFSDENDLNGAALVITPQVGVHQHD